MTVKSKLLLGAFLVFSASQAFAENPALAAHTTGAEPYAYCINTGGLSCLFYNLQSYQGNPNTGGAYFHCIPPNPDPSADHKFYASDYDSLITGFTPGSGPGAGSLSGPMELLNQYSFGAYEDTSIPVLGRTVFYYKDNSGNQHLIPCVPETGGFPVFPKPPGSTSQ